MARIRSVHPGLFTDEAFVSLSDTAQIVLIGLWTEADDQGLFEWKPTTLRMRLRPAKDGSMDAILEEIEAAKCIARFTVGGKQYGAIRNFRRFQRPKKPNSIHPMPPEFRTYVGLSDDSSELEPQREDGGGRMEDEGTTPYGSNEPTGVGAPPPSKKGLAKKGTRIAADWTPSQTNLDFAKSRGMPAPSIVTEAAKFRDHWLQKNDRDGVKRDWDAAWRTWVMRSCEWKGWAPVGEPSSGPPVTWIPMDDSRWGPLAEIYKSERGKPPIHYAGTNGMGFHFPNDLLAKFSVAA